MNRPAWRWVPILLDILIAGFVVCWLGVRASVQESDRQVTFAESRVLTLADLAAIVRTQTGTKLSVHRDHGGRQVFVSQGSYRLPDLLGSVLSATRLTLRKVGETQMLVPFAPGGGEAWAYPPLPRWLNTRARTLFEKATAQVDLSREGISFPCREFLSGREVAFAELAADQQAFVKERYRRNPNENPYYSTLPPPGPDMEEADALADLQSARIQLGTTAQLYVVVYDLPTDQAQRFSPSWMGLAPIYDQRWEAIDVTFPDDQPLP